MKKFRLCLSLLVASSPLFAADATFVATGKIASLAYIGAAHAGHLAGNFEIRVTASLPETLQCSDRTYVTTRASSDPEGIVFARIAESIDALPNALPQISFTLTDDPAYTAFPNRCSIKSVGY
jgi:hypothetical protein